MMPADTIPTFPDITPSSITRRAIHEIQNEEITNQQGLDELIDFIYAYQERDFYVFHKKGSPISPLLKQTEDAGHIIFLKSEFHFYAHPTLPPRNFVRVQPNQTNFDWQKKLLDTGEMYVRTQIRLSERTKREMALRQINENQKDKNPFILQPTFWGIGVDLSKTASLIKAWIARRRQRRSKS